MTRREGLLTLLAIVGRGLVGNAAGNITIDLKLLKSWEIRYGDDYRVITGEEIWNAIKGAPKG